MAGIFLHQASWHKQAWFMMESVDHNLRQLTRARVLVVGDVMLDQYWMGDVNRISPEAPVPVVVVNNTRERIGGAGNVAQNITALGGASTLLGIIGNDEAGRSISKIAKRAGINCCLEVENDIKTTIKLRVISRNQQLLRADFENKPCVAVLDKIEQRCEQLTKEHDVVVFSDYGKGGLGNTEQLIEIVKASGKLALVDPKGNDYTRYRGASMVTPNLNEFESVVGKVDDDDNLYSKAEMLIQQYQFDNLLVTLADRGMVSIDRGATPVHVAARSREVFDVSGAGDTVIAVMAMALAAEIPKTTALELANSAAGVVISKLGTAVVTPGELRSAMLEDYQS